MSLRNFARNQGLSKTSAISPMISGESPCVSTRDALLPFFSGWNWMNMSSNIAGFSKFSPLKRPRKKHTDSFQPRSPKTSEKTVPPAEQQCCRPMSQKWPMARTMLLTSKKDAEGFLLCGNWPLRRQQALNFDLFHSNLLVASFSAKWKI